MEIKNIYQRILSVYSKVKTVYKDAEISAGKSSYTVVTHDSVTRLLHDPISESGIVPIPNQKSCSVVQLEKITEYNGKEQRTLIYRADVHAEIRFVNADDPTQFVVSDAHAYAFDSSDKAIGKAYSMALKMIYLKVFMLESQDEEEARTTEPDYTYKQKDGAALGRAQQSPTNPLDYKIKFGKFKDKALRDVPPKDLKSMVDWLRNESNAKKKPLTGTALELVTVYEHLQDELSNQEPQFDKDEKNPF